MIQGSNRIVWLVLFAVLFGHTLLVVLPGSEREETGLVRTLILDGLTPIEKLFDVTLHGGRSVWNNYIALLDTRRQNERLREEVAQFRMEIARNREDVMEAERLRRLLDLDPTLRGERIVARVIGRDTTPSRRTITIDKGSIHGLRIDSPVMTPDGVVGRVVQTGHLSAIVQLVSDPDSALGVVVGSDRIPGIVQGDGTRYLELEHVDENTDPLPGDSVVTSGTDQIYPKGLPLGVIAAIGSPRNLMKTARVEPAVDLGKLEEVLCLVPPSGRPH